MAAKTFAVETITVGGTAIGFTKGKYEANGRSEIQALIAVETADIRFWTDPITLPTSTSGWLIKAGTIFIIEGLEAIKNFRAIAISGPATLQVGYETLDV